MSTIEHKLVIIESPFAGEVEKNIAYARQAMRDSLLRGEFPIASHLLYTQDGILDDGIPDERALGIAAGLAWRSVAERAVFYIDRGWSGGMLAALEIYHQEGFHWETRRLFHDRSLYELHPDRPRPECGSADQP